MPKWDAFRDKNRKTKMTNKKDSWPVLSSRQICYAFFLYKHNRYKNREPQIWPKIKHHLSTGLSLTSLQHTNFVYAIYFNSPIISVFSNTKIHLSYNFGTLNYSSLRIFKILWLGYKMDGHKSEKVRIACLTLQAKYYPYFKTSPG